MLDSDISTTQALRHLSVDESLDPHSIDRRRFLQLIGMGVGAGLVAGGSGTLLDAALGHDPSAWAAGPIGANEGVVVIIGMMGGNDGLNTVVPTNDGNYYTMHGSEAIAAGDALPIGDGTGLHPELTAIKSFWDAGKLAIVEGIGYPNPDLSHFNSMAYWMSGQPGGFSTSGWIGRWLDGYLSGSNDLFAAAEIGHSAPLHMIGERRRATVVGAGRPGYGTDTTARFKAQYAAISAMKRSNGLAGSLGQAFIDQISLAQTLAPTIPERDTMPSDEIVAQLEVAARLINANLGFRVLSASYGDFDSHANQPTQHRDRMRELNAAVNRFFAVLDPAWTSRVTLMTFSEFGRTPWSNDGRGTDHGTSAPHLVLGSNVKGGLYGKRASMAGLARWERMNHHLDFRSYYASIIDGWLGGGSSDVLGGNHENLGLFARGPGVADPDGAGSPIVVAPTTPSYLHPIKPVRIVDTREGLGAPTSKLGPGASISVAIAGIAGLPDKGVTSVIANVIAVEPTEAMYFTVSPSEVARPHTSNVNAVPGRPVPNLVIAKVGSNGNIDVFNSHGNTHCVVDVFGYTDGAEASGSNFHPLVPERLFDSREGLGLPKVRVAADSTVQIDVAGHAGVPSSGATAVVLNLTCVAPNRDGHLTVSPTGRGSTGTSNVNFGPGETVPNLVICELGDGGRLDIDSAFASTELVGDVFGYFGADGDRLIPITPARLLDTREGLGAPKRQSSADEAIELVVTGVGGVPSNASAVALNVTATNVAGPSHVSVWPTGESEPSTSSLNIVGGDTRANMVICQVGDRASVSLGSRVANADLVADVMGYFVA